MVAAGRGDGGQVGRVRQARLRSACQVPHVRTRRPRRRRPGAALRTLTDSPAGSTGSGAESDVYALPVFIPGILGWGGGSPSLKRLPNCVLQIFFFGQDDDLQIYHGNFLLMGNKHGKLFVIKLSKGCKFMCPKIHQNTFGGRVPPADPPGSEFSPRAKLYESCVHFARSSCSG